MEKIGHILVPAKGTPDDDDAVRLACIIARKNKAKITVIYVIEVQRTLPLEAEIPTEVEKGELALDRAELIAAEADYQVSTDLLQARMAGPAIVDEARDIGAGLIILGIPYRTHLGEFYLGSTTTYVLKNAPCRVWVCRESMEKSP